MNKDGPIIVIHNDVSSQKLLLEVFNKLEYTNEVLFFHEVDKALHYIEKDKIIPFLIFLEINLHITDRLLSKIKLQRISALQSIPYLYFSRSYDRQLVTYVNKPNNQGFFIMKNLDETVELVTVIIEYWKRNATPSDIPNEHYIGL